MGNAFFENGRANTGLSRARKLSDVHSYHPSGIKPHQQL